MTPKDYAACTCEPNIPSASPICPTHGAEGWRDGWKVVHNKREPFDVYIGRPSKWGNPFSHKDDTLAEFKVDTRDEAVDAYAEWIKTQPDLIAALPELRGRVLGCWCAPQRCHGDVLVAMANG